MHRAFKVLLASTLTLAGFCAPAHATPVTLNGAVTAAKDVSLAGVTVQLEAFDADAETYSVVSTATATPAPSPTSTRAPYSFSNVQDGTYRVRHTLLAAEVPTSKFGFSESTQFTVEDGKISVDGKSAANIPDFKMNSMGKYYVQATDASDGAAVPNAIFTISGDFNGQATTFQSLVEANASGTAVLPIPSAGEYSVSISDPTGMHENFTSQPAAFVASYTNSTNANQFPLTPAGLLAVTVTTNGGRDVVAGATARIYQSDELVDSAVADATGVVNFKGLAEGDYVLYVGGPEGSLLKDSDAISVTISAGNEATSSVNLANGLTISGLVSAGTGPVDQVRIDVEKLDDDGNEVEMSPAQSGPDGRFTTNGLSAGTYNLYFFDESSDRKNYRQSASALGIVVTTKNVTNVNALLPAASVIAGTVKNEVRKALGDVTVQLTSVYGENIKSVQTDKNGQYQIPKVTPGKYVLKFSSNAYRVLYTSQFDANADQLATQDAVLVGGSGISGRVVLAGGGGIEGLQVSLFSSAGSGLVPLSSTLTQADGTYEFGGLIPDSYRIKYDGTSGSPVIDVFWQGLKNATSNPLYFDQASDIVTRAGQVSSGVNPLPAKSWQVFTGTLKNGDVGIPASTVILHDVENADMYTATTDDNGAFSVSAPNGKYRVELLSDGFARGFVGEVEGQPTVVKLFSAAILLDITSIAVSFENDWSMTDWNIDLSGTGGTVKINVLDETKEPVTYGEVVAYNIYGAPVASVIATDDNGTFVLSGLRGTYYFSYEAPGDFAKRYLGDTLELSDPKTTSLTVLGGKAYSQSINVVSLPNVTLKVLADDSIDAPLYDGEATVEVYTVTNGRSVLDQDLSTTLTKGISKISLAKGESYRIRVVPDDVSLTPIWVGDQPLADNDDAAAIVAIPVVGKMPTLGNVVLNVKASVVTGTLTDTFNNIITNGKVELFNADGDLVQSVKTREDGVYNIYRINPGTYTLKFIAEQFTITRVKNVVLTSGIVTTVNQTLKSATGVTGKMLGSDGLPLAGATVRIYSASGTGLTPIQSVTTDDDGYYNFIGLAAGSYKIKFDGTTADVPTPAFWYGTSKNELSFHNASVVVAALGSYTNDINPQPGVLWTAFRAAIQAGDLPIEGALVSLVSNDGFVQSANTNSSGLVRVSAPDGDYQVLVQAVGYPNGYVTDTPTGAVVEAIQSLSTTLHIANGVARFESGLDLISTPLDLATVGGTLKVQVVDGSTTLSSGLVKVYNRAGQVVASVDQVLAGTFQLSGLLGDFFVSYEEPGEYGQIFLGSTKEITDPATILVRVRDRSVSTATINAIPLPRFTVNVKSGNAAYLESADVNVYQYVGDQWELQSILSGTTRTGSYRFAAEPGEAYRVQVVPEDAHTSATWVGSVNALSVEQATSYTMPVTGAAPTLPAAALGQGARVTVPVKNARLETLENVTAHLDVTLNGKFVEFAHQSLTTLEADVSDEFVFSSVPISMFPIRVTVGSSQTAEEDWTSSSASADVTTKLFQSTKVAVPATVTGRIAWTDDQVRPTAVSLVTDNGETFATVSNNGFGGVYTFENVPLGVHFTVVPSLDSGFVTAPCNICAMQK